MSTDNTSQHAANTDTANASEDDNVESIGECHRMAAHHFAAAAKHHLAAGAADDEGLDDAAAHHAFLAYRHQLNGVQYAEIAVMNSETLDDADEELDDDTRQDGTPS